MDREQAAARIKSLVRKFEANKFMSKMLTILIMLFDLK